MQRTAQRALIDTGPLVALFDRSDRWHKSSYDFLKGYAGTLITSWPVITETVFLLDFHAQAQVDFLSWLEAGGIQLGELNGADIPSIKAMIHKYANVPMDLADATLIRLADRLQINHIVTLDHDFEIYRMANGKAMRNLLEI
jgi:uncharacterized protein